MTTLDFDICIDASCSTMTFTELTGAYSASNTGGWGTPNVDTTDATVAILQITTPSGGIYTLDLFAQGFPVTNTSLEYTIPLTSLGLTTNIPDGNWSFLYYVTGSDGGTPFTYQAKKNFLFYCNSECCVNKLLADVNPEACDCDEDNEKLIDNYLKATVFLDSLKNAARCYQVTLFTTIKSIIDKLCANSGCTTCK